MTLIQEVEITINGEQVAEAMAKAMREAANRLDPKPRARLLPTAEQVDATRLRAAAVVLARLSRMGAKLLGEPSYQPGDLRELAEACHRIADLIDP